MNEAEKQFYDELMAFCKKWDVEFSIEESHYHRYSIKAWSYTQYKDNEKIRDSIDIDFGSFLGA